jgi:hypothetical protein
MAGIGTTVMSEEEIRLRVRRFVRTIVVKALPLSLHLVACELF